MTRDKRVSKLDTQTARKRLAPAPEPYWTALARNEALGYYRPANGGAGTWWARIYFPETRKFRKAALKLSDDFEEADGQRVLTFNQAGEAARVWFGQVRQEVTGQRTRKGPFLVSDALDAYVEEARRRGVKGLDRMESAIRAHIRPALGNVPVAKLTRDRIQKWHLALAEAPARVRTRAGGDQKTREAVTDDQKRARRDTANRILTVLKAALNEAKRRHLFTGPADAWADAEPFRRTTKARVRFLTPAEQALLVNACDSSFRPLVMAALFTGCRFGELARLLVCDFDATAGTVFVAESKSGKPRHIPMTDEGRAFFLELTAGRASDSRIFERQDVKRRKRQGREDQAWMHGDYHRPFHAAVEAAKVGAVTFHELRHSYASGLVNKGVPLAYVAAALGHTDTRMVEKHYGHLSPSAMAESIRTLAPKLGIHTPGNVQALDVKPA